MKTILESAATIVWLLQSTILCVKDVSIEQWLDNFAWVYMLSSGAQNNSKKGLDKNHKNILQWAALQITMDVLYW